MNGMTEIEEIMCLHFLKTDSLIRTTQLATTSLKTVAENPFSDFWYLRLLCFGNFLFHHGYISDFQNTNNRRKMMLRNHNKMRRGKKTKDQRRAKKGPKENPRTKDQRRTIEQRTKGEP